MSIVRKNIRNLFPSEGLRVMSKDEFDKKTTELRELCSAAKNYVAPKKSFLSKLSGKKTPPAPKSPDMEFYAVWKEENETISIVKQGGSFSNNGDFVQ